MTKQSVRDGVLGAKGFTPKVIDGGAAPPRRRRGRDGAPEETCPVLALGQDEDGAFVFLAIDGKQRKLTARQLGTRMDVSSLFLGDDAWLRKYFPRTKTITTKDAAGAETEEKVTVAYDASAAGEFFMRQSRAAGQFGPHVILRKPGTWPDAGGVAVHCGDAVLMRGNWRDAGFRDQSTDIIWPSLPKTPRPGWVRRKSTPAAPSDDNFACGPDIAQRLQEDIRDLWSLRRPGGEIILLGLIALGYYGAAVPWRSNGFLMGPAESGKSALMTLLRAAAPLHHYTNDTSKAGLEQNLGGRAMTIFVDEASDRVDPRNAQALMDMVLAASGGEGARGHRGGADGAGRTISLIGVVLMSSVNPPDMKEQHRRRITLVELNKAEAGADHLTRVTEAIERATVNATGLWARALAGFPRWRASLAAFRAGLADRCSPGEMDQLGSILASHWVLTADGVPDDRAVREAVASIAEYIRGAGAIALDDAPRRLVQHLASFNVQQDRSTDQEPIGVLLDRAFSSNSEDYPAAASKWLQRFGIRPVRLDAGVNDAQGRLIPRPDSADGDGIWFAPRADGLRKIMRGTDFEGDRFTYELLRFPSSVHWKHKNVRIGGYAGPAIWISLADWDPDRSVSAPAPPAADPPDG